MSGCLVSRYSIALLWSEWETWKATLAVSYVSPSYAEYAALVPSLAFTNSQSFGLSIIFVRTTFSLGDHWPCGLGVCSSQASSPSAPPTAHG